MTSQNVRLNTSLFGSYDLDPDPHPDEKSDSDPHRHQIKNQDPNPDPHPDPDKVWLANSASISSSVNASRDLGECSCSFFAGTEDWSEREESFLEDGEVLRLGQSGNGPKSSRASDVKTQRLQPRFETFQRVQLI
jgi:hypothetical protein